MTKKKVSHDTPKTRPIDTSLTRTLPFRSDLALRRRFMVLDEAMPANTRFGLLLEVLDKLAEETALAYVNRFHPDARVVTAAIDNILIRNTTVVTRDIIFNARINHVGRSSLEVGIRVEQPGEPVSHIASCYFTMVARSGMGADAVSVPLPPLEYSEEIERERARKALASRDRTSKAMSNSCLFTFVNVDREMKRLPVPPVYPTTYAEDARYLAAHRSHQTLVRHFRDI